MHFHRFSLGVIGLLILSNCAWSQQWTQNSFDDFMKGKFSEAGQNLYVSKDGKIRSIHRFDYNQDGNIDLLFNSTHDYASYVPSTLGWVTEGRKLHEQEIAVQGTRRVMVGDLGHENVDDLVFLRSPSGIQGGRSLFTIAFGGKDGWPASRVGGGLPEPRGSSDIALADLDADGWPDVIIPGNPHSYIYWGGKGALLTARRSSFTTPGGALCAGADFDGDGAADLAVASPGKISVFWAKAGQRDLDALTERTEIPDAAKSGPAYLTAAPVFGPKQIDLIAAAGDDGVYIYPSQGKRRWAHPIHLSIPATHVSVGDLDKDGFPDLVITNFTQSHAAGGEAGAALASDQSIAILWGSKDGFAADRATRIAAAHATATAVGDFDSDGHPDLAVAIHEGDTTFQGTSLLFWGQGNRKFVQAEGGFSTQAPADVAAIPARNGQPPRLVFCNSGNGTIGEKVPLDLYWGGHDGFDPKHHWQIPNASGYCSTAADLKANGFVDLLFVNSGHNGHSSNADDQVGIHILWGGADGFSMDRTTILRQNDIWSLNVADLNRDGYLDLIACQNTGVNNKPANLYIYWGGADSYKDDRVTAIPMSNRCTAGLTADMNNDGWLDLVCSDDMDNKVTILWGGPNGYSADRSSSFDVDHPVGLEVADLNADGWLDLMVGRYSDAAEEQFDLGNLVFWGGPDGFKSSNSQWLPGLATCDFTVADFDGDGYLDIFCADYHANDMRESIPSYVFWGGKDGFRPGRKTRISADSAHGGLAADFNHDGLLDLAISCHTQHGDHHTMSKVLFNDGKRFANPRIQELPTAGTHWMCIQDMGNVRDRSWKEHYESSQFHWDSAHNGGKITFQADIPTGCALRPEVRSASGADGLARQPWRPATDGSFTLLPNDRWMQYRAVFISDNGDRYPTLSVVNLELSNSVAAH